MSPGPLTSRQHGGHGFGPRFHGYGYGRIAPPAPRQHVAQHTTQFTGTHQRFSVGGDGKITLDPGESLVVDVDEDGGVRIGVKPPEAENGNGRLPANGNGNRVEQLGKRHGLFGRVADKMAVSSNSDGSITIRPEGDAVLQIVGDPLSGAITVVEIVPEPLNTPNAQ
jgi:hypothetical protein